MIVFCPRCGRQHIDAPARGWNNPPHCSHLCAFCGWIWRPCARPTIGVAAIEQLGLMDSRPVISGEIGGSNVVRLARAEMLERMVNETCDPRERTRLAEEAARLRAVES